MSTSPNPVKSLTLKTHLQCEKAGTPSARSKRKNPGNPKNGGDC